jgi:hypothetical protein
LYIWRSLISESKPSIPPHRTAAQPLRSTTSLRIVSLLAMEFTGSPSSSSDIFLASGTYKDPSYRNTLPPPVITAEITYLWGIFFSYSAFGASIALGLQCLSLLGSTKVGNKRMRMIWKSIVTVLLVCSVSSVILGHAFTVMAWVDYRNYPGGPRTFTILGVLIYNNKLHW